MQLLINGYSIKKCFKKGEKKSPYDLFFDSKGCTSNQTHKDAQTQGQDVWHALILENYEQDYAKQKRI